MNACQCVHCLMYYGDLLCSINPFCLAVRVWSSSFTKHPWPIVCRPNGNKPIGLLWLLYRKRWIGQGWCGTSSEFPCIGHHDLMHGGYVNPGYKLCLCTKLWFLCSNSQLILHASTMLENFTMLPLCLKTSPWFHHAWKLHLLSFQN